MPSWSIGCFTKYLEMSLQKSRLLELEKTSRRKTLGSHYILWSWWQSQGWQYIWRVFYEIVFHIPLLSLTATFWGGIYQPYILLMWKPRTGRFGVLPKSRQLANRRVRVGMPGRCYPQAARLSPGHYSFQDLWTSLSLIIPTASQSCASVLPATEAHWWPQVERNLCSHFPLF